MKFTGNSLCNLLERSKNLPQNLVTPLPIIVQLTKFIRKRNEGNSEKKEREKEKRIHYLE